MNDYRLDHSAPADDGYSSPLPDILKRFGPDVLDRPDLYGNCDDETLEQMRAAVADPDGTVRYRRTTWRSTVATGSRSPAATPTTTGTLTTARTGPSCSPTCPPARCGPTATTPRSTATTERPTST